MKNGMRHGPGTYIWDEGTIYKGEWLDDKAHGLGQLIHINGEVYEGEF